MKEQYNFNDDTWRQVLDEEGAFYNQGSSEEDDDCDKGPEGGGDTTRGCSLASDATFVDHGPQLDGSSSGGVRLALESLRGANDGDHDEDGAPPLAPRVHVPDPNNLTADGGPPPVTEDGDAVAGSDPSISIGGSSFMPGNVLGGGSGGFSHGGPGGGSSGFEM